ncbi:MAG: choice-of-anchor V domain-containing protein [Pyrinomonadaceae bacterium]
MTKMIIFRVKLAITIAAALAGAAGFMWNVGGRQRALASGSGPTPSHTNAPGEATCTQCHIDYPLNSGSGGIAIDGIPGRYTSGQQIQVSVTVSEPSAVNFGFQLTAIDSLGRAAGTFTLPASAPPRMQIVTGMVGGNQRSYVEHTIDGLYTPGVFGSNTWTFTWTAPATTTGTVRFFAAGNGADGLGTPGGDYIYTTARVVQASGRPDAAFDFDGDRRTDIGIFRPSGGQWWYQRSSNGSVYAAGFGASTDVITPADFTGDGRTDIAFFRPSTGNWYILRSEDTTYFAFPFGANGDVPVPADHDGDGKADPAVYRPSASTWYVLRSSNGVVSAAQFGVAGDKPVAADYDGDGKADIAIFRPSGASGGAEWWILRSTGGAVGIPFGSEQDLPVPADWTGDGRADIAFFRPGTSQWYVLRSEDSSYFAFPFGAAGDVPAPGDYDGDARIDAAVFRPSNQTWFVNKSSGGTQIVAFGAAGDLPIPSAFVR